MNLLPGNEMWGIMRTRWRDTMSEKRRPMARVEPAQVKEKEDPQRLPERDPEGTEPRGLPYLFDRREVPTVSLDDPCHSRR